MAAITSLIPFRFRSPTLSMCFRFLRGTIRTSALRVNTAGFEQKPSPYSPSGIFMFAEANTSAGAPCRICAASAFEPAKEKCACGAIAGKASVSDAAA